LARALYLHLPAFPLQCWALEQPGLADPQPVVAVELLRGLQRVVFASPSALKAGVRPGMTATAASALLPHLIQRPFEPHKNRELLLSLGESLPHLSSVFQLDPPEGLWLALDAAHLHGGETGVLEAVL
jgi:protein ImuB